LSRANANAQAIDESANDEHSDVLRSANNNRTNAPNDGANLDGPFTAKDVGQESRSQCAEEGATRHGRSDTALDA
jgi:hypothetical protein